MAEEKDFPEEVYSYINDKGVVELSNFMNKMKIYDVLGKETSLQIDCQISKIHSMFFSLLSLVLIEKKDEEWQELYEKGTKVFNTALKNYFEMLEDLLKEKS